MATEAAIDSNEAALTIGADGTYLDATPAACEVLGMTLDELRSLPAGALSSTPPEDREALQEEFARTGSRAAVGESTVLRPDGQRVRVRFALVTQADGNYRATIEPVATSVDAPPKVLAIGEVLRAWRATERHLEQLRPGTDEYAEAQAASATLRKQYAELFRRQQDSR